MAPLKVDTSGNVTNEGPPTPTHSESQDCIDARKRNDGLLVETIAFFFVELLLLYF